jgi:hypothetical protein
VVDGHTINQPVLDWLGAAPLNRSAWTYRLSMDAAPPPCSQIQSEVQYD